MGVHGQGTRTNKEVLRGSEIRVEFRGKKSSRDTVHFLRRPLNSENGSSSEQAGWWVLAPTRMLVTEPRDSFLAHSPADGEG